MSSTGAELCGGAVVGQHSILIAAHCLFLQSDAEMRISDFYVVAGMQHCQSALAEMPNQQAQVGPICFKNG